MRMNKMVALSVVCVLLAACSHHQSKALNPAENIVGASPAGGNAVAAQSYSAQLQTAFKTDQQGYKVNPLTAPANQVYYFSFNQSAMRSADVKALLVQANYLLSHPAVKVRLEGNTDNRGSREYNVALGWRRDQTVARLLEQQGVKPQQLDMISFGKERPVAFGNDTLSWSLNRRVNLKYERMS